MAGSFGVFPRTSSTFWLRSGRSEQSRRLGQLSLLVPWSCLIGFGFAKPLLSQPPVVVEGARGTFTLESGVPQVSTSLFSNLNVEYMEGRVLMGKLMGKQLDARTIKWKLGLTWWDRVKQPFYLDNFGHRWYVVELEFRDEEELKFALDHKPWVPVQYRDAEILKDITQLLDLRLPLKRLIVVNDDKDCLFLLSYEKLFQIYFYCGQMHSERHSCPVDFDNDVCLLVDRIFEDEPVIFPENFPVSDETKNDLQEGVMLVFPQPTLVDEFGHSEGDGLSQRANVQD
ncbi:hypothetical protein D8674_038656 [Pyrus ussuriensis x Pyrus communis]|uniref:DUF4283 domain-containing protein n=1 Tax=Pyrus ussuriensis x Pyrus communis TaxID=2448454 RepID=A0A5N5HYD3_9ROSA|nr:hypothetical protein D8674_038656 [Pyrus ussuriensis x Pyrus communis]